MKPQALTADPFHCRDCGHRGPALGELVTDWVPYGDATVPMTTIQEPYECEPCGGKNVVECLDVGDFV